MKYFRLAHFVKADFLEIQKNCNYENRYESVISMDQFAKSKKKKKFWYSGKFTGQKGLSQNT